MAQNTFTKDEFWAELAELGEEEVRVRVATKRYGNASDKYSLACEWLDAQERGRNDSSNLEQIRIARSAKNAAWAAATAAIIAAISAVIAILSSE